MEKEFSVYGYGKHFRNKITTSLKLFKNIKIKNIISKNNQLKNSNIIKKLTKKNSTEYVYISTPVAIHYKNLIEAINTEGVKVIICEKSITDNYLKTLKVIDECKKNKILLLESFMYKYHPQFLKIKELILNTHNQNKKEIIFCRYTIPSLNNKDHRQNPKLTGGEIFEIGCYPISILYFIFSLNRFKLKKIKIIKNFKKNNKQLVCFELNKLKFVLSWGYNSNYRNRIIFYNNNNTLIGNKIFGKQLNDNINITVNKNKITRKIKFNKTDNFYFMFRNFFSIKNNYKNRNHFYNEIAKVADLINFFNY